MSANTHRVFVGESKSGSYLNALQIEREREDELRAARNEIRETIRSGFSDITSFVKKSELFETARQDVPTMQPKFKMQGSFAYRMCNAPEHTPPQEIDLDDGLFLPVSFLSGNGQFRPDLVSTSYFAAVEKMLAPLCKDKGWSLEGDKPACVRVRLADDAHVDMALYAIPDKEFVALQEHAMDTAASDMAKAELRNALGFDPNVYKQIPVDHIMLAHRDEGWKPSDPRKLDDWFHANLEKYGEQYRRVCRYIKGWRDYTWEDSKLPSIALMSAVATAMEETYRTIPENRDDLAVLAVAERLPTILSGRIDNPVVKGQRFDEGWDSNGRRQEYVLAAQGFHKQVRACVDANEPEIALSNLNVAFGERIPDDQSLVELDGAPMEVKSHSVPAEAAAVTALSAGLFKALGADESARAAVQKGGSSRYA